MCIAQGGVTVTFCSVSVLIPDRTGREEHRRSSKDIDTVTLTDIRSLEVGGMASFERDPVDL